MTKPDPDDAMTGIHAPTAQDGTGSRVTGPLGVVLGLGVAAATGFFLSEDGPPPGEESRNRSTEIADQSTAAPDPMSGSDTASGVVSPTQMGAPPRPGGMPPVSPEIVVKFKDSAEVKEICNLFWKDKAAAQEAFAAFIANKPYLEGLQLKRATYSNELVLDLSGIDAEPGSSELRSRYYEATRKLRESPDVSYAEPNATARPGKDDK
ncbi:MAG: hypothetical protein CME88_18165 [Hirschia sp.]|nr:hypothetical protein [Hirschia sp.]